MGTSKHVAILLVVALTGILAAGQDQPAASSQTAPRGPSDTRSASCIVRITVDPAILPLNPEAVRSLIHCPAVLGKALREVLSVNSLEDFMRPNRQVPIAVREPITIRWLSMAVTRVPPAARSPQQGPATGYDAEMMRQFEEVYGRDYMRQMQGSPGKEEKGEAHVSPQKDGRPGPGPEGRSGAPGMNAGAAVGAMGGMGMGGMGMTSGASWVQEQLQRLPGETDSAYRARILQIRDMRIGTSGGITGMGGVGGYDGMQSATIELQVNLPDTVPARADEFLKGIVKNLQDSLSHAYESCAIEMERTLAMARAQYQDVESESDGRAGDVARVRQQLESFVDASALTRQMPLEKAVDVLRRSVEPPLNIVVLWRDMLTNAHAEPASPINIEGSPKIRLATALDLLVKGLHDGVDKTTTPIWRIKDDTVIIGTTATLGATPAVAGQPKVEADVVNLAGQRSELARRIQSLELDLAGLDARRAAIVAQIAGVEQRVKEKVSKDPVIYELEKLADIRRGTVIKDSNGRVVPVSTPEEQEKTIRAKIELANRREELSKQVGGGQLDEFNKELSRMAIDKAEKEAQHLIVQKQLDEVQKQLSQALTFDPEAARLRLARESLDITARRVAELQMRLSNLQPPLVTVIGANGGTMKPDEQRPR